MPPYGAITLTVVVDATIDTFNQTAYIVGLAALLGNVPRSAIQLSVTAGSLVVRATVRVYSTAVNNSLMARIYSITPAQLAAATGSSVLTISGVTATRLFPSPTQPPPPSRVPLERDGVATAGAIWSPWWWLLIALGIGVCVLLVGLLARWLCCSNSADEKDPAHVPAPVSVDPAPVPVDVPPPIQEDPDLIDDRVVTRMAREQSWYNNHQRMAGSPGSPVVRTPAPSSGPGRKTFRGPERPSPAARPPPPLAEEPFELDEQDAQPPEWVLDVTSPTEVTAKVDVAPGSIAAQNESLARDADEHNMEIVRSTRPAAPQTVSSLNVRTDEVQPRQLVFQVL